MVQSLGDPACVSNKSSLRNDPKFSDRYVKASSEDPDQTAPEEQSDQGLHCLLFHLHTFNKIP